MYQRRNKWLYKILLLFKKDALIKNDVKYLLCYKIFIFQIHAFILNVLLKL